MKVLVKIWNRVIKNLMQLQFLMNVLISVLLNICFYIFDIFYYIYFHYTSAQCSTKHKCVRVKKKQCVKEWKVLIWWMGIAWGVYLKILMKFINCVIINLMQLKFQLNYLIPDFPNIYFYIFLHLLLYLFPLFKFLFLFHKIKWNFMRYNT